MSEPPNPRVTLTEAANSSLSTTINESPTPHGDGEKALHPSTLHNGNTRLLSLPGELRNMIWRYTLIQEGYLILTPAIEILPPLTRVCSQIQQEAASIYFSEQEFLTIVTDFDGTAHGRFQETRKKYLAKNVSTYSMINQLP